MILSIPFGNHFSYRQIFFQIVSSSLYQRLVKRNIFFLYHGNKVASHTLCATGFIFYKILNFLLHTHLVDHKYILQFPLAHHLNQREIFCFFSYSLSSPLSTHLLQRKIFLTKKKRRTSLIGNFFLYTSIIWGWSRFLYSFCSLLFHFVLY